MFNKFFSKEKKDFNKSIDYIIAGLGNPGRQYENTRHNVGFMLIDNLANEHGIRLNKIKFKGITGTGSIGNKKVLLLKPSTFMNLSGQSVTEAMRFYKLPPEKVLLAFDDISLPVGRIRMRRKGSDGGHNGIKNIIYLSGSDNFPRIKIGVGNKPHPDYNLADWVLSSFSSKEQKELNPAIDDAAEAVKLIMDEKMDLAMSRFN